MRKFILDNFIIKSMLLTADVTFSGTTTSPIVLFLKKQKPKDLNYDIFMAMSPKYLTPTGNKLKRKEEDFLGYSFSSNRKKSGIDIKPNSTLQYLTKLNKEFISNNVLLIKHENIKIVKLSDILLNLNNGVGDIYPKYEKTSGTPLNKFCNINARLEEEVSIKGYLEIGDLETQAPTKKLKTTRFCKAGDILISSLTPTKNKIVIAKDDFMLSPAIYVLSGFESAKVRDIVFAALRSDRSIKQMNTLLDGFKVTYAKISDNNLFNNVYIDIQN